MQTGQNYFLDGGRERVVTVLDTPPEIRTKARVRVRFLNGVKTGEVADVPSRRIVAPVEGPAPSKPRVRRPRVIRIERPPVAGDEVYWKQTGEIVWTVDSVDADTAILTGALFGKPAIKTVPVSELEVPPVVIEPDDPPAVRKRSSPVSPEAEEATLREQVAPDRPRRELDALLEDVMFSIGCLDRYRRRFAKGVHGPALNERLREEIRTRGYIVPGRARRSGEYRRIRIEHRYDVVLPREPSPDDPVKIDELWFQPQPSARRKRGGSSKGAWPSKRGG
jgi:hypothetical protein